MLRAVFDVPALLPISLASSELTLLYGALCLDDFNPFRLLRMASAFD